MVSNEKLQALRAKYADAGGSDVFDPELKKVVTLVFKSNEAGAECSVGRRQALALPTAHSNRCRRFPRATVSTPSTR
jgi:hypothetical protein